MTLRGARKSNGAGIDYVMTLTCGAKRITKKMESIGKSFKKILLLLSHFASKWPKKMKFKKKNTSQPKNNIKQLYITKRHVFPNVFFGVTSLVLGSFHHHHMDRALTLEFNKAATTSWWPFMDPLASGIQH